MIFRLPLLALALAGALTPTLPALAQDHSGHAMTAEAPLALGDIAITGPFTRATLPNAPVAGGFLTLTNNGAEDDRLVAVTTPVAQEGQIHEMAMENDIMKMRQLPDGLVIPAGESVTLAPGGLHLMFMGLKQPLVEGEAVPVTLTFETAGEITVDLPVAGTAADAPSGYMGH